MPVKTVFWEVQTYCSEHDQHVEEVFTTRERAMEFYDSLPSEGGRLLYRLDIYDPRTYRECLAAVLSYDEEGSIGRIRRCAKTLVKREGY